VRRSFFKGGLRRHVCLGVSWARHHLAPTVAIQKPVDRRGGHLLAQSFLVGLLDLRHRQHAARLGTLDEWRQKLLLLLWAEVLVMPAVTSILQ